MVYFIQDGDRIKIGFSKNPEKRLSDLQVSNSRPLVLLGTMKGGRGTEQRIHTLFEHLRITGEWFFSDPTLLHFIRNAKFAFHKQINTRSVENLSKALKYYRNSINKTQAETAKSAGIKQSTVSNVEKSNKYTEIGTIYQICAALGLELILRPRLGRKFDPEDFT